MVHEHTGGGDSLLPQETDQVVRMAGGVHHRDPPVQHRALNCLKDLRDCKSRGGRSIGLGGED